MAVWRCPHCATPQPESSRCWVCRRSTTSCASCRHFRRAVAGGLGMCGLDPRRTALTGDELRACWTAAPPPPEPDVRVTWGVESGGRLRDDGSVERRQPRTFVPVEPSPAAPMASGATERSAVAVAEAVAVPVAETDRAGTASPLDRPVTPAPVRPVPGRWWLWGDPEPWPEP